MTENIVRLAAGIVQAYVSNNPVPTAELPKLIEDAHSALTRLLRPLEPEVEKPVPAVNPKRSISPNYIISLEDGKKYKTLKRHLANRGMTPEQYREKWDLPQTYPMVAANYAAQRSELAKSFGLGQRAKNARKEKSPQKRLKAHREGHRGPRLRCIPPSKHQGNQPHLDVVARNCSVNLSGSSIPELNKATRWLASTSISAGATVGVRRKIDPKRHAAFRGRRVLHRHGDRMLPLEGAEKIKAES